MFLSRKSHVVALHIGTHSIKLIKLKKKKSGFELENCGMAFLPPEAIVDDMIQEPEAVVNAIKNLFKSEKLKTKNVVIGISGESVVIKKINLPIMKDEELAETIRIEAEQYIPFDIDDVNIDFQVLKNKTNEEFVRDDNAADDDDTEERQCEVLLVAAKKDIIEERVKLLIDAGLKPVVVDVDVFAMENGYDLNYGIEKEDEILALVDIGASTTNINVLEKGITAFTKDIPIGGIHITQAIQSELNIGYEIAENLKLGMKTEGFSSKEVIPIVVSALKTISQEIGKSFEFYSTAANKEIAKVALSGGCASISGIEKFLEEKFAVPVEIIDPFRNIKINNKVFDQEYIDNMRYFSVIGIGLAMRRFYDR